ncbi:MAG TPA: hypothetical protein VFB60_26600 [Ktedonobacteraceae bacterium]|nr:hypothetical protein [Ktedonobacteraceae bacterium]
MNTTIFWLAIFILCSSLLITFFSIRTLIRERRRTQQQILAGERQPRWYTNVTIRREIGTVFFMGVLVIEAILYMVIPRLIPQPLIIFWLLLFPFCFFTALYRVYTTFSEEYERRRLAREAGKVSGNRWASLTLHRGLAGASLWIGIPLPFLLTQWDIVQNLTRNPMDIYFWLVGIFAGMSGLYWLSTYVLEWLMAYQGG